MKSVLSFISFCFLCAGVLACFEEQPLQPNVQEYLALKKSCSDTLFPEPPCCGNSTEDNSVSRIVNGELTGLRDLTWTVYIDIEIEYFALNRNHGISCGGSLINSRWVLSAAHCFVDPEFRFIKGTAHIGEWNITSDPDCIKGFCAPSVEKIGIAQVIAHPEYIDLERNDLALVRLKRPVAYSEFINPICLPFTPLKKRCFENQKAVVAGWGKTNFMGKGSEVKLKTTLTIWEMERCAKANNQYHICASAGRNYTCSGDSGGPLSLKLPNGDHNYLVGVVSSALVFCMGPNFPASFAVIDFKWIADVILEKEAKLQNLNK